MEQYRVVFRDLAYRVYQILPWKKSNIKNNEENFSPFFIIGSGRSGTTLLRRVIIQNPNVHIPPETYVLGKMVKLYSRNAGIGWNNLVKLMLATLEYQPEFSTFNIPNLQALALNLEKTKTDKRSLAFIIDQFYRYHARSQGRECKVWGDKTPFNTMHIDQIRRVFPKAKYIYLIRDGYDVAFSYYKAGLYKNCYDAAMRWLKSNKKALDFERRNGSQVLRVKYEELVGNPEKIVSQIFAFLNLEYDSNYIENTNRVAMGDVETKSHHYNIHDSITTNSIGKGKMRIPKKELNRVKSIIAPMNQKLGYLE